MLTAHLLEDPVAKLSYENLVSCACVSSKTNICILLCILAVWNTVFAVISAPGHLEISTGDTY